jgi:hypothetical protein
MLVRPSRSRPPSRCCPQGPGPTFCTCPFRPCQATSLRLVVRRHGDSGGSQHRPGKLELPWTVSQRLFDPYRAGTKVYQAYRAGSPSGRAGGCANNPTLHLVELESPDNLVYSSSDSFEGELPNVSLPTPVVETPVHDDKYNEPLKSVCTPSASSSQSSFFRPPFHLNT